MTKLQAFKLGLCATGKGKLIKYCAAWWGKPGKESCHAFTNGIENCARENKPEAKENEMKKIIVVCLVLGMMGCASAGKYFTIDDANRVTNGMTREEVIQIMGTVPYQIIGQGKKFIWSYAQVGISGRMESRAVPFTFDDNGKTYGIPDGGMFGDTQKYLDR